MVSKRVKKLEMDADGAVRIELSDTAFLKGLEEDARRIQESGDADKPMSNTRASGAGLDDEDDDELLYGSGINPNKAHAQAAAEGRTAQ